MDINGNNDQYPTHDVSLQRQTTRQTAIRSNLPIDTRQANRQIDSGEGDMRKIKRRAKMRRRIKNHSTYSNSISYARWDVDYNSYVYVRYDNGKTKGRYIR